MVLSLLAVLMAGCAAPRVQTVASDRPERRPTTLPVARLAIAERIVELGDSADGRPMRLHVFGSAPWPTLILGGIHGNEPTSSEVCVRLIAHLRQHPEVLGDRCVAILPQANPDGLASRSRVNRNRVDLNRNFPSKNWVRAPAGTYFGGAEPSSEPETRTLIKLVEEFKPARIVSIHAMARPCNNFDGPAEALAQRMSRQNHYPVVPNIGYTTPGSLGQWAGFDRKIPIVTLELPSRASADQAWEDNRAALISVIRAGEDIGD